MMDVGKAGLLWAAPGSLCCLRKLDEGELVTKAESHYPLWMVPALAPTRVHAMTPFSGLSQNQKQKRENKGGGEKKR